MGLDVFVCRRQGQVSKARTEVNRGSSIASPIAFEPDPRKNSLTKYTTSGIRYLPLSAYVSQSTWVMVGLFDTSTMWVMVGLFDTLWVNQHPPNWSGDLTLGVRCPSTEIS